MLFQFLNAYTGKQRSGEIVGKFGLVICMELEEK